MTKSKNITAIKYPPVYEIKISLENVEPVVWRKVLVHGHILLEELHGVVQVAMGWESTHAYEFIFGNQAYTVESIAVDTGHGSVNGITLDEARDGKKSFAYVYDFGDYWEHKLQIVKTHEHEPRRIYPVCIGGENACPPEDCGGSGGFEHLKKVISGKSTKEKGDLLEWLGGFYDPTSFDPNFVNRFVFWNSDKFDADYEDESD